MWIPFSPMRTFETQQVQVTESMNANIYIWIILHSHTEIQNILLEKFFFPPIPPPPIHTHTMI